MLQPLLLVTEQPPFHALTRLYDLPVAGHAWGGALALLAALIALTTAKGSLRHQRAGHWFALGVGVILITGALLWHRGLVNGAPHWLLAFLFLLAGSTLYATASGWRMSVDPRPWLPWRDSALILVAVITSGTAGTELFRDLHRMLEYEAPQGEIALRPFVVICLTALIAIINAWFIYDDVSRFRQPSEHPSRRVSRHLQRMMVALIAVLTAFFIVELSARFFDQGYALWPLYLGPGIVLSPLMILFHRRIESRKRSSQEL